MTGQRRAEARAVARGAVGSSLRYTRYQPLPQEVLVGSVQPSDRTRHASLSDGSSQMRAIGTIIENVADTDATVLIRGESGVGKDLVARAIHAGSSRRHGPFVKINCEEFNTQYGRQKQISPETMTHLQQHAWSGNVRELENVVRRLVVLTDVEREIEALAARGRDGSGRVQQPAEGLREIARRAAREAERRALEHVLRRVGWNRAAASRILKVSYKTLLTKIVDCGLTPSRTRPPATPRAGGPSP